MNFNHVFGELDKFCTALLSIPAAQNHPEARRQIDFIRSGKERLRLAQAEEMALRQAQQAQLTALQQGAQQREEAHRRKLAEINKPSAPLDGNALGRALLKNLGFTK